MDVRSLGPLTVGSVMWQSPRGGWVQTVVVKATFDLVPGEARLADKQDEPAGRDHPYEDATDPRSRAGADGRPGSQPPTSEASRSVYAPSDLAPFKPHTDVVLVGHAYAPGEEPVKSLVARLVVGELDKSIEVVQDRTLGLDGELREGPRFTKMPLRYERAAGGPETWNPVGLRIDDVDALGRATLPNLQPLGTVVKARGDAVEPTGFGPLSEAWWSRRERLGRHAKSWQPTSFGDRPLPDDIDPTYFNAAPRDQQLAALRDDAPIALENLNQRTPRLVTRLPGIRPRAFVEHEHGPVDLRMAPDTLWIDTDRAVATVTWRGQVLLEGPQQPGMVYVALERAGAPTTWGDVMRMLERKSAPPSRPQGTEPGLVALPSDVRALPFAPADVAPASTGAPMTIGQALVAATQAAAASADAAAPAKKKNATPATEDLMTLAGAIGSGKAPPWLAMHAARSAPGGAKSLGISPAARSVPMGDAPSAGPGTSAPVSPVPATAMAATLPAGSGAIDRVEPRARARRRRRKLDARRSQPSSPPHNLDMTMSSPRVVRSGTQPIGPAIAAAVVSATAAEDKQAAREGLELLWMDATAPRAAGADADVARVRRALQQATPCDEAGVARALLGGVRRSGRVFGAARPRRR